MGFLELVNVEQGVVRPFQLAQSIPRPCVLGRILLDILMDPPDKGDPIQQALEEVRDGAGFPSSFLSAFIFWLIPSPSLHHPHPHPIPPQPLSIPPPSNSSSYIPPLAPSHPIPTWFIPFQSHPNSKA